MNQRISHVAVEIPAEEAAGFGAFFASEYPRLCKALFLLTGDRFEAEDVAQEAMLWVFEHWDRVGGMDTPTGYLFRAALNIHRSRLRRLAVRARRVFAEAPAADHGPVVDDREDVRHALAGLSPSQREVLILVDWLDLDTDEAGDVLHLSPNAVRVRVHRARSALRETLGGAG